MCLTLVLWVTSLLRTRADALLVLGKDVRRIDMRRGYATR